jgi:hypothetical protein
MRHGSTHALSGQSASHMQAIPARLVLHLGHTCTVVVQPIACHHQTRAWLKGRGHDQGHALLAGFFTTESTENTEIG